MGHKAETNPEENEKKQKLSHDEQDISWGFYRRRWLERKAIQPTAGQMFSSNLRNRIPWFSGSDEQNIAAVGPAEGPSASGKVSCILAC